MYFLHPVSAKEGLKFLRHKLWDIISYQLLWQSILCKGYPISLVMVLLAVVLDIVDTSGQIELECVSVIISSIFPLTGPAKPIWIRCHGRVGQPHE